MKLQLSFVSILLVSMVLFSNSLLAQNRAYTFSGGSGTVADPYLIATFADLQQLSSMSQTWGWNESGSYFEQTHDIEADPAINFTPIKGLRGEYNGNGFVITNLIINWPNSNDIGLFGSFSWGGIVKNLGVENISVTGLSKVGALAGNVNTATTFENCYSTGSVSGSGSHVGGLIGYISQTALSCSYSTCDVQGNLYVGGLIGLCNSSSPYSVENCFARGNITATGSAPSDFGGLIGKSENAVISNCFSTGSLDPTISNVGGLVGAHTGGPSNPIKNSYWDVSTSLIAAPGNGEGTGLPTPEMLQQLEYNTWDFSGVWTITPGVNDGYPYLDNTPVSSAIFWTGASSSDFADKDNWNKDYAPDENLDVVITSDGIQPTVAATAAECGNLTIEDGASITVESTGSLDVNGDLTIMSNANGTGSLLVDGTCSVTGTVRAQRYLVKDKYHYVSSPLNTGAVTMKNSFNTAGDSYLGLTTTEQYDAFFSWDESNCLWLDLLHTWDGHATSGMDSQTFEAGESYCYADGVSGNSGQDNTAVFEGTIRTSDVTFAASYTAGEGLGYHIVGNPFTSTLAINNDADNTNNFLSDNAAILDDDYEAVYVWDEGSAASGVWRDNYRIICNSGFAGVESGDDLGQDFVSLGQGFMIRVNQSGNVVFNKATQKIAPDIVYYKSKNSEWSGVQLFANSETVNSSTLIGFNSAMSNGVDPSYEAGSLLSNDGANLYTLISGTETKFAIQSLPLNCESVQCGIDVESAGYFTFSIYDEGVAEVTLEDKFTGEITSLKNGNSYTAYLEKGSYSDRFILHVKTSTNGVANEISKDGTVYSYQDRIYFNNIEGEATIVDMSGRVIRKINVDNSSYSTVFEGYANGVYLVKTEKKSFKIVL